MNAELFAEVLVRQQILILERKEANEFQPIGGIPDWCVPFLPTAAAASPASADPIALGGIFAYLDFFLEDAERSWESGEGELRSGIWTEHGADDSQLHLMAVACSILGKAILVIRRLDAEFDDFQRVYQKGRELLLAQERYLAEAAKKEILLHCIVHDLAGPLAGLTSALNVIDKENLSETGRRFVQLARRAAKQQSLLIEDLLATFRSELRTEETLHVDPANAPDLIACGRAVIDVLSPVLVTGGVQCRVEMGPDMPERLPVRAEMGRLERLFHNLIQNALRYSSEGETVTVTFLRECDKAIVMIDDEGPGIPPEIVPQLFQKFVRGDHAHGKAGLGLYFCRISVEQWGGEIGYEPRKGGGTRFWFKLDTV